MNLLLRAAFVLGAIFVGVNLLNYFVLGHTGDYLPVGERMGEWKEAIPCCQSFRPVNIASTGGTLTVRSK